MPIIRIQMRNLKCQCGRPFRASDIAESDGLVSLTCSACHDRPLELEVAADDGEEDDDDAA